MRISTPSHPFERYEKSERQSIIKKYNTLIKINLETYFILQEVVNIKINREKEKL